MSQRPQEARKHFGQSVDLCTQLGKILAEYPPGENILFELLQNADDAGASTVVFALDERNHARAGEAFSPWNGTALLAYNNSIFRPEDFEAIQRVGRSSKVNAPGRTGKFGIGFNSVYHMTDVPSFVSNNSFCLLDPVGVTGGLQGRVEPLAEGAELPELRPFRNTLGCQFDRPYQGTLFRFPLRLQEHHRSPLIAGLRDKDMYTSESVLQMFESFQAVAHRTLLFLRNVMEVRFVRYDATGNEQQIFVVGVPEQHRSTLVAARAQAGLLSPGSPNTINSITLRMEVEVRGPMGTRSCDWLIVFGVAGINDHIKKLMARDPAAVPVPPVGAVAVDLNSLEQPEGSMYCTLPLPISTKLFVQLNSAWELPANRRTIWYSAPRDSRTNWNIALGMFVLAPLYVRLLAAAVQAWVSKGRVKWVHEEKKVAEVEMDPDTMEPHALGMLWPTPDMSSSQLLPIITSTVYIQAYASTEPLFPVYSPPHPFVVGSQALFLPTHEVVPNQAPVLALIALMFEVASKQPQIKWRPCHSLDVRGCVAHCGCRKKKCVCPCSCKIPASIVSLPPEATKLLIEAFKDRKGAGNGPFFLTPKLLASALRSDFFDVVSIDGGLEGKLYEGQHVTALLNYLAPTTAMALEHLPGVPLALTITATHYKFASDHMLAFCSSEEELEIINQSRSLVLHNCIRDCHSLLDPKTATALKLIQVSPLTLGTTFIKNLLPKGWDQKDFVAWNPQEKAADPKTPSFAWLQTFWKYVSVKLSREQPAEVKAVIEALGPWPLIPTLSLRLYPVRAAGMIFPTEPKERVHDLSGLLSLVGCQVLSGPFAEIGKCLASSMLQLTAAGIVNALSNPGISTRGLSHVQAVALLKHIAAKATPLATELPAPTLKALSQLALFPPVDPNFPLVNLSQTPCTWPALKESDMPLPQHVPQFVLGRPSNFLAAPEPELSALYRALGIQPRSLVDLLLCENKEFVKQVIEENKTTPLPFVRMVLREAQTRPEYASGLAEVKFIAQRVDKNIVMRAPCELMHIAQGVDREAVMSLDSSLLLPNELASVAWDMAQLGVTRGLDDANTFLSCLASLKGLEKAEGSSPRAYNARMWLVSQLYRKHEQFMADERVKKEVLEQPFVYGLDCAHLASAVAAVQLRSEGKELEKRKLFRFADCVSFDDVPLTGRQCPCLCPDFTPPVRLQSLLRPITSALLIANLKDVTQAGSQDQIPSALFNMMLRLDTIYGRKLESHREIEEAELAVLAQLPCLHNSFGWLPPSSFVIKGEFPLASWPGGLPALSKLLRIPEQPTRQHVTSTLQFLARTDTPTNMLWAVPFMNLLLKAQGPLPPFDQIMVPTRDKTLRKATEVLFGDDELMATNTVVPLLHEEVKDSWAVARLLHLRNISEVCEWRTDPDFVFKEAGNAQAFNQVLKNPEFGIAVVRVIKHGLIKNPEAKIPNLGDIPKRLASLRVAIVESIQASLFLNGMAVGKTKASIRAQLDRSQNLIRVVKSNTPQAMRSIIADNITIYLDNPPVSHLASLLDGGLDLQGYLDDVDVTKFQEVDEALEAQRAAQRAEAEAKERARLEEEKQLQLAQRRVHDEAVQRENQAAAQKENQPVPMEDEGGPVAKQQGEAKNSQSGKAVAEEVQGTWSYKLENAKEFIDFDAATSQLLTAGLHAPEGFEMQISINQRLVSAVMFPKERNGFCDQGQIELRPPQAASPSGNKSSPGAPDEKSAGPENRDAYVKNKQPDLSRTLQRASQPAAPRIERSQEDGPAAVPIPERACHPVIDEDLVLIPSPSYPLYVPKSASDGIKRQMIQYAPQLGDLMANLCENVVGLPAKAVNLVWLEPVDGSWTKAFNRGGGLYFNVGYFVSQLQSSEKTVDDLQLSWFLTLCHELAHNQVGPHNADFARELGVAYTFYFKKMAGFLSKRS